jgi:hypothetical protein
VDWADVDWADVDWAGSRPGVTRTGRA